MRIGTGFPIATAFVAGILAAGMWRPAPATAADALQAIEARPGSNDAVVEMGQLGAPDTSGLGLLTSVESGVPKSMWQGTSRATAEALLQKAPAPTRSRALQSLGRRVLLTEATAPQGEGSADSFLALRLRRLIALGDLEAVVRISDELIVGKETSAEQMARTDALLLRGADGDACLMARDMVRFAADIYWTKLDAYCKARAGDLSGGEFDLSLIHERDDDPVFFSLYDRLVLPQRDDVQPAPFDGSALAFAFLRAARAVPETADFATGAPALLRAVALDAGGTSADVRLTAAVEAAAYGAFPIDALRALFTLQGFPAEALADPAKAAGSMVPARALALFYQAIAQGDSPRARVTLTSIAYRYAARHDLGSVVIDLVRPLIGDSSGDSSLSPFAPDMTRACLAGGDMDCADSWFALVGSAPPAGADPIRFAKLQAAMVETPAPGDGMVPAADPALSDFDAAVAHGAVAEAVLRALDVIGPRTPAQAGDAVIAPVAAGLATLGLGGDARAVLREAALAPPDLTSAVAPPAADPAP